ncbi:unnamed protein product, partial [Ectocarpus sp. 8 AP-2014]
KYIKTVCSTLAGSLGGLAEKRQRPARSYSNSSHETHAQTIRLTLISIQTRQSFLILTFLACSPCRAPEKAILPPVPTTLPCTALATCSTRLMETASSSLYTNQLYPHQCNELIPPHYFTGTAALFLRTPTSCFFLLPTNVIPACRRVLLGI